MAGTITVTEVDPGVWNVRYESAGGVLENTYEADEKPEVFYVNLNGLRLLVDQHGNTVARSGKDPD
jgi:hypothetical protein